MLGVLQSVIDRVKPLVPEFKIAWADKVIVVLFNFPRYSMGFIPKHIEDIEEILARIDIQTEDDPDRFVVVVEREGIHKIPLTIAGSGRSENGGYVYDWRLDAAAAELAAYLKGLANLGVRRCDVVAPAAICDTIG